MGAAAAAVGDAGGGVVGASACTSCRSERRCRLCRQGVVAAHAVAGGVAAKLGVVLALPLDCAAVEAAHVEELLGAKRAAQLLLGGGSGSRSGRLRRQLRGSAAAADERERGVLVGVVDAVVRGKRLGPLLRHCGRGGSRRGL